MRHRKSNRSIGNSVPEVDADVDNCDDVYDDPERMFFMSNVMKAGLSYALIPKSNGDQTCILYDDVDDSDYEVDVESNSDCDNVSGSDIRIRRTRSMARKAAGSNCLSKNVGVKRNQNMTDVGGDCSGLAKKRKCGVGRNIDKCLLKKRKIKGGDQGKRRSSVVEVESVGDCGDLLNRGYDIWLRDVLVTGDGVVYNEKRCEIENGKGDESASANRPRTRTLTGKIVLKSKSRNISTRKNPERSVVKKVGGGGCSVKVDKSRAQEFSRWNRREKPKNDRGNGADTKQSAIVKVERAYDIWLRDYVAGEDVTRVRYNGKGGGLGKDNVGASSESEVEVLDRDPDCTEWNYTSVAESNVLDASMEEDEIQYIGERRKPENPQFRKDVVKILGRPYNEKEYENLWLQVKTRKPTQGHRDLRGGLKTYSTDTMGRSYLDEYDDFARKLDAYKTDLPRKLNLLRGFFYYLQSLAHDGIFKPWLDDSCLAIIPRTE